MHVKGEHEEERYGYFEQNQFCHHTSSRDELNIEEDY